MKCLHIVCVTLTRLWSISSSLLFLLKLAANNYCCLPSAILWRVSQFMEKKDHSYVLFVTRTSRKNLPWLITLKQYMKERKNSDAQYVIITFLQNGQWFHTLNPFMKERNIPILTFVVNFRMIYWFIIELDFTGIWKPELSDVDLNVGLSKLYIWICHDLRIP